MKKDFDNWNNLKKKLDNRGKYPTFKEGGIWWVNIGMNIGNEQCGKSSLFSRPVLILKNLIIIFSLSSFIINSKR